MRILSKRTSGSTLVEVVMAVGVIGIIGGALMGAFSYGFFIMQLVRENQRATQVMTEKLETVRLYRWEQLLEKGFLAETFADPYDPQGATESAGGFKYYGTLLMTIPPTTASYSNNIRELVITLNWTNNHNFARTRKFATLVSRNGLQNYVY